MNNLQQVVSGVFESVKGAVDAVKAADASLDEAYGRGNKGDKAMFQAYVDSVSKAAATVQPALFPADASAPKKVVVNAENLAAGQALPGVQEAANAVGEKVGEIVSDLLVAYAGRYSRRLKAAIAVRRATKIYLATMANQVAELIAAESLATVNGKKVSF